MAAGYDGSIRIDTKIDAKGFNQGTRDITKGFNAVVKGAARVAVALTAMVTVAVVTMAKLTEETREFRMDLARLEINALAAGASLEQMNEAMRKMQGVTGEIDSNVEGLSNLLAAGFKGDEFEQALDSLAGAAIKFSDTLKFEGIADGLQETLATGKAIGPFAELLERSGIALEGFDAGLQAAIASGREQEYILEVLANTGLRNYYDAWRQLNPELTAAAAAQYDLQVAMSSLATTVEPVMTRLTIILTTIINLVDTVISRIIRLIAQVKALLTGKAQPVTVGDQIAGGQEAIAETALGAAKAEDKLAKATEAAGKAAKGSLSSFDELNLISEQQASAGAGGAGGVGGSGGAAVDSGWLDDLTGSEEVIDPWANVIADALYRIKEKAQEVADFFKISFGPVIKEALDNIVPVLEAWWTTLQGVMANLGSLWEPLKGYFFNSFVPALQQLIPIVANVFAGLLDGLRLAFEGVWQALFPILEWFAQNGLELLTNWVVSAARILEAIFFLIKDIFDALWEGAVAPGLMLISDMIVDVLDSIKETWDEYGADLVDGIIEAINSFKGILVTFWNSFLGPFIENALGSLRWLWEEHLSVLVDQVLEFVAKLVQAALDIYNGFIAPVTSYLIKVLGPGFSNAFSTIVDVVAVAVGLIADIISGLLKALGGVIDFIAGIFTGDWERAWEGIQTIFKGILNGVISLFEAAVNFLITGLNSLIRALNTIQFKVPDWDWLPDEVQDKSFGVDIRPINKTSIPRLATGAYLPPNNPMLAIVGDNPRSGEFVLPEDKLYDTVYAAMKAALAGQQAPSGDIVLQVDSMTFGRIARRTLNQVARSSGALALKV